MQSAIRLLEMNRAAVAILDTDQGWVDTLSALVSLPNPPEVIVVTHEELSIKNVLHLGAHDLLRRPFTSADLLWSIATAWHT